MAEFKDRLKSLRKEKGLKQNELAKKLNASRVTITRYENGTRQPDIGTVEKIAEILNVQPSLLFEVSNVHHEGLEEHQYLNEREGNIIEFKDRLKSLRKEKNMTLQDICNSINVGKGNLSSYENGHYKPSMEVIIKIANLFSVSTDYLLGVSDIRQHITTTGIENATTEELMDELYKRLKIKILG